MVSGFIKNEMDIEFAMYANKCNVLLNCELYVDNSTTVKIKLYNEKALEVYNNCGRNDYLNVEGELYTDYISVRKIEYIKIQ